ncbi:copper transporter [Yinghuangia sp. ASG 101]|uniref:copper transporter n=1 Tax=Yinghuangia sp. ASG 101 TaxID=2896848 RepID=UPI001E356C67|nr:copper transporter [Yinghuangia sp. ASG 101]UGQ10248.1 copper transporter [Yinghuangia sp. ASG 101]
MIDFRYHVVSIIAVFLALSVGLVLGSSFLADIVKEDLDGRIQEQTRAAEAARRDLRAEEGENRALNNFIDGSKPQLVANKLKDKSVVLVTLPDASSAVTDATVKTLQESGATITGTIAVKDAWTDPAKEPALTAAAGATTVLGQSGYDRAAAVLAAAIVHKAGAKPTTPPTASPTPGAPASPGASSPAVPPQGQGDPRTEPADPAAATPGADPAPNPAPTPPATGTDPAATGGTSTATPHPTSSGKGGEGTPGDASTEAAAAVLNRFEDAGFLDIKGKPEVGATLAVVVAPSGPVHGTDPVRANTIYLGLSRAIDTADDGTVVAGDTASVQNGGTVAALRADERTAKVVSSVDAAETTQGQVAVDWALVVESVDGKSGQYGATGQQGWLPPLPADKTDKTDKTGGTGNTETERTS